jgi:hypothetical protein
MFLCNTCLSILGMGDAPTFTMKGDVHAFVMGEGMGGTPAFMIKADAPLETCVSFAFIIRDMHLERMSPFCQRSGRILDINLTEMH